MNKEVTARQTVFLSSLMLLGRLSVMSESSVGRDTWIIFMSIPLLSLPLVFLYCSITDESTDIPAAFTSSLGKPLGFASLFILSLSALFTATSGIDLFNTFINSSPIEYDVTFRGIILMSVTYCVMLSVSAGSFCKAVNIFFPAAAFLAVIGVLASLGEMDPGAIFPVLEKGTKPVFKGIISSFLLQVAPLFYMICTVRGKRKAKPAWLGLVIASFLLLINHLRNVMILGYPAVTEYRFPNYIALSQISLGDLFQGMEVITAEIFIICQPIKSAVCLRFIQEWLVSVFPKTKKIWRFILPALCAAISLSGILRSDSSDVYYKSAAGIPLIVIPVLMFLSNKTQTVLKDMRKRLTG